MIKSLKNNPILAYQMRNAEWPPPLTTWLIAAALSIVGLGLPPFIWYKSFPLYAIFILENILFQIEVVLLFVGPLLTIVAATVQAADTEAYQMIHLSEFSEIEIVRGYAASALFRLRLLWMVAGGIQLSMAMTLALEIMDSLFDLFLVLSYVLLYALVFIAWNYLAVGLGIWMAFWQKRIDKALVRAIPLLVLIIASETVAVIDVFSNNGWTWQLVTMIVLFAGVDLVWGWWALTKLTTKTYEEHSL